MAKSKNNGKLRGICQKSKKILDVLYNNKQGLRAKTIIKLTGYPSRTVYNKLNILKKEKLINNIYPIWKIAISPKLYKNMAKSLKSIQGHKFSFILKLLKKPYWWEKRNNKLYKLKEFHFKDIDWSNKYTQLTDDNFYIQTFANSIIFINRKKYWNTDPYNCFLESLEDTLDMIKYLEEKLNFRFYLDAPQLSVRSMHLVKLKDTLAEKCKKHKNKFLIEKNGKPRVWIDMSEPIGLEFGHKNYAPEDVRVYSKRIKDILDNDPSLPSSVDAQIKELTNNLNTLVQNQMRYAENINSHIGAIQELGRSIRTLTKVVKDAKKKN